MLRLFIPFIVFIAGCSARPDVVRYDKEFSGVGANKVYIVNHGWHTGLVVPASAVQNKIPELVKRFGHVGYLEFGWGDIGFYQASEITSGLTLRAIFWPTESVMHVVAVQDDPEKYFYNGDMYLLCLNDDELTSVSRFIADSFYMSKGQPVSLKNGLYGDSQFYRAEGDYYLFNTCNKWTAKALKSIGMDLWPVFKLTASSIMDYLGGYKRPAANIQSTDCEQTGQF